MFRCGWRMLTLPPNDMRQLLRDAIEEYIDPRRWELEKVIEEHERRDLGTMLEQQEDEDS
jgi:hypothetical protein